MFTRSFTMRCMDSQGTLIDVDFTVFPFEASKTTTEVTSRRTVAEIGEDSNVIQSPVGAFQACGIIAARVGIAVVDILLAVFASVTSETLTMVIFNLIDAL